MLLLWLHEQKSEHQKSGMLFLGLLLKLKNIFILQWFLKSSWRYVRDSKLLTIKYRHDVLNSTATRNKSQRFIWDNDTHLYPYIYTSFCSKSISCRVKQSKTSCQAKYFENECFFSQTSADNRHDTTRCWCALCFVFIRWVRLSTTSNHMFRIPSYLHLYGYFGKYVQFIIFNLIYY
jgi:hypothetical protein